VKFYDPAAVTCKAGDTNCRNGSRS